MTFFEMRSCSVWLATNWCRPFWLIANRAVEQFSSSCYVQPHLFLRHLAGDPDFTAFWAIVFIGHSTTEVEQLSSLSSLLLVKRWRKPTHFNTHSHTDPENSLFDQAWQTTCRASLQTGGPCLLPCKVLFRMQRNLQHCSDQAAR